MKIKSRFVVPISGVILILIVTTTILIYNNKHKLNIPNIEDIKSVKIIPFRVGASPIKQLYFDLNNPADKKVVMNIVEWLKAGQLVGSIRGAFVSMGSSPTCLYIESNNGSIIKVTSAQDAIETKLPNGNIEVRTVNSEGKITINADNMKKPLRMVSPELKSFINNGWQDRFKSELEVFDENKAISMVIRDHPDFPSNQTDTLTKKLPTGGPAGAITDVKFTTEVTNLSWDAYIVTLIKDWGITVNGEYVKSSWAYKVTPGNITLLASVDNDYLPNTMK